MNYYKEQKKEHNWYTRAQVLYKRGEYNFSGKYLRMEIFGI